MTSYGFPTVDVVSFALCLPAQVELLKQKEGCKVREVRTDEILESLREYVCIKQKKKKIKIGK